MVGRKGVKEITLCRGEGQSLYNYRRPGGRRAASKAHPPVPDSPYERSQITLFSHTEPLNGAVLHLN